MAVTAKDDPYVQNILVAKQLQKQVLEENSLQKSIVIMQQSSAHFEEGIVRSIQSTWQTFDEWQSRTSTTVQQTWHILGQSMASLSPDREWIEFAARTDHLLDPDTPLRNPEAIEYPFKNDASVVAVHVGLLERKKRWSRSWEEGYFVLTPSGWLHQYASSDPTARATPMFSVFLPLCTLGPPSTQRSKSHKFTLEGKHDSQASRRNSFLPAKFGGNTTYAYTFRARSHEEMMEWWHDCRMLVSRYLIASDSMDRSGPVEAAVRAAGYNSSDLEGGSDEEEGSSVEEEEHQEEQRGQEGVGASSTFVGKRYSLHDDAVPEYTQNGYARQSVGKRGSRIEVGPNGYAVSKPLLRSSRLYSSFSSWKRRTIRLLAGFTMPKRMMDLDKTSSSTVPMFLVALRNASWRRHQKVANLACPPVEIRRGRQHQRIDPRRMSKATVSANRSNRNSPRISEGMCAAAAWRVISLYADATIRLGLELPIHAHTTTMVTCVLRLYAR